MDLPVNIGDPSGFNAQFSYAPDRRRWRQVASYSGGTETTIYIAGLLEKLTTTSSARTHWKHLIDTPSGQIQVIRRSDASADVLYFATDHLGSVDVVTNASGAVVARLSYTVHGARRNSSTWSGAPTSAQWLDIANTTRRGFTGHEHLDNVMLVHMNGRVFDPQLGRFLSADPFVDGAATTQGWNRYSYTRNNLLGAVDPSGFSLEEIVVSGSRFRQPVPEIPFQLWEHGTAHWNPDLALEEVEVRGARPRRDPVASDPPPALLGIVVALLPQSSEPIEPESPSPRQQCLNENYGDSYDIAWDLSPLSIPSLLIDGGTEYLEDKLRQQANRNLYGESVFNSRQYEIGKRQIRTLSQFRWFNAGMAVAGAGALGYLFGANVICSLPGSD